MISEADKSALIIGLKQVKKALTAGRAKTVYVARDCDDYLREQIEALSEESGARIIYADTMKQLGQECGIDVSASCACIC